MASSEDGPRVDSGLRRKAFVLGTAIALVALVVGSVFGDRGLLNLIEERERVEILQHEIEALRSDNARLVGKISDLRHSPRAIEQLAREELGLARPDETVFLIREDEPGSRD